MPGNEQTGLVLHAVWHPRTGGYRKIFARNRCIGVGASEGERSPDPAHAVEDLREGLTFLLESTGGETAAVAGFLSGAWAALGLAREDPRVDRVLLVSPEWRDPPADLPAYADLRGPVLVVAGDEDPSFDRGAEAERVDAARNARLRVLPGAGRHYREALTRLARLVPPFLGAAGEEE